MHAAIAERPRAAQAPVCERCHDEREITHAQLGRIPCPRCSHPERKDPPKVVLQALNGVEARRVAEAQRMIHAAVQLAIRRAQGKRALFILRDPRHRVVDRILQRWAVGHGDGGAKPEDAPARPPALDPETQNLLDDMVKASPERVRYHTCAWYRSETPCHVIAANLGVAERGIYRYHEVVLEWWHGMMLATEHVTLVRLLKLAEP